MQQPTDPHAADLAHLLGLLCDDLDDAARRAIAALAAPVENVKPRWVTFSTVRIPGGPLMAVQKNTDGCSRTIFVRR